MESRPTLIDVPTMHFIGIRTTTSLSEGSVPALWRAFKPRAREVRGKTGGFYNLTRYPETLLMQDFTPQVTYEAWATVRVKEVEDVPEGMEVISIPEGTYAVFEYRGLAADFGPVAAQIYGECIPAAGFEVDNSRPHFEYLSSVYRPDDPAAEEEIWIPVVI